MPPKQKNEAQTNVKRFSKLICSILLGDNILLANHFPMKLTDSRASYNVHRLSFRFIHLSDSRRLADQIWNMAGPLNKATVNAHVCICV